MKIDFNNINEFLKLEDKAIDGILDYDNFPPAEYKYFSKLSKLGYLNRHKGWSAKICEEKQSEYKKQYYLDKEEYDRIMFVYGEHQKNILKSNNFVTQIYKSENKEKIFDLALQVIEILTDENGFADRIHKKIRDIYT